MFFPFDMTPAELTLFGLVVVALVFVGGVSLVIGSAEKES